MPRTDEFVYDPTRPDFQANAHAVYRVLRDEHPVYRNPATDIWALSRYADVRDAATDTKTFSSENTDITVGLLPQRLEVASEGARAAVAGPVVQRRRHDRPGLSGCR